jgi:hypothetical protein
MATIVNGVVVSLELSTASRPLRVAFAEAD